VEELVPLDKGLLAERLHRVQGALRALILLAAEHDLVDERVKKEFIGGDDEITHDVFMSQFFNNKNPPCQTSLDQEL
jgi:hypothetical protein